MADKKASIGKRTYTLIVISINFILINKHLFKHDNNILSNALKGMNIMDTIVVKSIFDYMY